MGQYWLPVNLDKKEFIYPHRLGSGLKLWEQLANHPGTGAALVVLCAAMPKPRGGGDFDLEESQLEAENYQAIAQRTIGRWAGDRIALVGDYADCGDLAGEHRADAIYGECRDGGSYKDITNDVCAVIEHELQGKYTSTGWRRFVHNE